MSDEIAKPATTEIATTPRSCDIRYLLYTSQQAHGLRHKDYSRYHGYCTRKLRRLRKYTKIKFGNKRQVTPISIAQLINYEREDDRHFLIAVFEVERCWAAAMEYKQLETARGNHHAVQRFRKAVKYANELELCSEGVVDARTTLEIKAYYCYLKGLLEFELQNWVNSEKELNQCKTVYAKLGSAAMGVKGESYTSVVDEVEPLHAFAHRYAAFNAGEDASMEGLRQTTGDKHLDEKMRQLISKAQGEEEKRLEVVEWEIGYVTGDKPLQVPVELNSEANLSKVKEAVQKIKDSRDDLENLSGDAGSLEALEVCEGSISACQEAIQSVRNDVHAQSGKADAADLETSSMLLSFLQYNRSLWMAERNLYCAQDLIEKKQKYEKPEAFARLFDLTVGQFADLASGEISAVTEISKVILTSFKALRAYYLSLYESGINKNYRNALALNRASLEYAMGCAGHISGKYRKVLPSTFEATLSKFLTDCITDLETTEFQLRAYITSSDTGTDTSVDDSLASKVYGTASSPLMNDLNNPDILVGKVQYPDTQIIEFPPKMKTTMQKPILFDVAESYIEFPDLSDLMPVKSQAKGDGKDGLVGKATSWFGWGGQK